MVGSRNLQNKPTKTGPLPSAHRFKVPLLICVIFGAHQLKRDLLLSPFSFSLTSEHKLQGQIQEFI